MSADNFDPISRTALLAKIEEAQKSLQSDNSAIWELNKNYFKGLAWAFNLVVEAPTVMLPCKIGDVVWGIKKCCSSFKVIEGHVSQMFFVDEDMRLCICVDRACRGEWGKRVFATKEEAEEAVRKLKEETCDAT